jgi:hypothetical protein
MDLDCVACATRPLASVEDLGEPVIFIGHRPLAKFYAWCEMISSPVFSIYLLDSYHDFLVAFKSIGVRYRYFGR